MDIAAQAVRGGWRAYALAVVLLLATLGLRVALTPWIGDRPVLVLFVIPVILSTYLGGLGPGLLCTALAALTTGFFMVASMHGLPSERLVTFGLWLTLILAGVLISVLNSGEAASGASAAHRSYNERRLQGGFAIALACLGLIAIVTDLSVAQSSTPLTQLLIIGGGLGAFALLTFALVAIRRDFAGRQRAEVELERFFSLSLDFLCISSSDGYFKRVSPAVTDVLGWTAAEFLSKPFLDYVHPEDHAATLKEVDRQVRSGEKVLHFENRYRHKDGSWRVLAWRSSPQPDGLMYATARDITELRQAGQALLDVNEQLEGRVRERTAQLAKAYEDLRQTQQAVMQQERLLALGQMASGIAHDINNAISPVTLYTDMLLEQETSLTPSARAHLETIQRAIGDVALTVARMREFYREREPQMTLAPVDLNELVQQVADLTRARWHDMAQQRGIAIQMRTELFPDLPAIMAADNEIREALVNLVFNAVDAMPAGGVLRMRTLVKLDHSAAGAAVPAAVQLEVIDGGIGMDENTRNRCLEPFFTTKGERGTGLGLAMVYGTMQRHSADIEIDSAPGKGTTVRLSFALPTTALSYAQLTNTKLAALPSLRILVVDDDPLVLKSLRDSLEADGHVITTASGGQTGIDAFRAALAQGSAFPVVITDLGMPGIDGRAVAAAIKGAAPPTYLIMLTGWGQRLIDENEIPVHVDRVLKKPPKLRELREALISRATMPFGNLSK